MGDKSKIEWTDATWNPLRGCTRVSPGCQNCYAERLAAIRLSGAGQPYEGVAKMTPSGPRWTNKIMLIPELLDQPLRWKKPRMIFVNSMSDLFHKDVPFEFIQQVFETMKKASWHIFQVLTKRSERLAELAWQLDWSQNVWMGVSVENEKYQNRIDDLRTTPAHIKFLSLEPLIGPLPRLNLEKIDWAIVGGESGPGSRPIEPEWVIEIREQCIAAKVPFFFKQWGGINKKVTGRVLEGRTWDEMPHKNLDLVLA